MIVVNWIFSHPKSNKIIQGSFDLFAAYFCEVQINAGSSVNLDAAVEPASVSRRKQENESVCRLSLISQRSLVHLF